MKLTFKPWRSIKNHIFVQNWSFLPSFFFPFFFFLVLLIFLEFFWNFLVMARCCPKMASKSGQICFCFLFLFLFQVLVNNHAKCQAKIKSFYFLLYKYLSTRYITSISLWLSLTPIDFLWLLLTFFDWPHVLINAKIKRDSSTIALVSNQIHFLCFIISFLYT